MARYSYSPSVFQLPSASRRRHSWSLLRNGRSETYMVQVDTVTLTLPRPG